MENQELIAKAKSHFSRTVARGLPIPPAENFPKVRVRDAARLCFESANGTDQVVVFVDRQTGEFMGGGTYTCKDC